jgi:hypothetical protein
MNPARSAGARGRRGHTLVEMMIVLTTMTAVLGGSMVLMEGARSAWRLADTESRLQERGRRVLQTVLGELRRSGLTTVAGANYPAIWEHARGPDADPRGALVATMNYADESLVNEVFCAQGNGDRIVRNDGRVSDEMVFQLPADVDGNGTPLDADGDLEWGPELFSYRVVDDAAGQPWLYRYTEIAGAVTERRIIAPSVASITFDVIFNDRTLRFSEVAVVLYLEELDDSGQRVTTAVEGVVGLRNTREL